RHVSPVHIALALLLNGAGMSPANIQVIPGHLGVTVHVDTVTRWLGHYAGMVEGYTKTPYGRRAWGNGWAPTRSGRTYGAGKAIPSWRWTLPHVVPKRR
ncbi:MAG: hypothetical protein J4G04_08480, partial [Nitrosopumilaceae archaeon]|nr:hypothetical protein [Nitrosopumilaceae archaeon]